MHLAKEDGDVALTDVNRKQTRRNHFPALFIWLPFPELSVHDCSAIPLDDLTVLANNDALYKTLIDQNLRYRSFTSGVFQRRLSSLRSNAGPCSVIDKSGGICNTRIAWIKSHIIEWKINALHLHTLSVEHDSSTTERDRFTKHFLTWDTPN